MKITDLRRALDENIPVEYSAHCQKRMLERGITREDIRYCIYNGEIIEDYPLDKDNSSDKSFDSCLIMCKRVRDNRYLHMVVGYNEGRILLISVCYPDTEHWLDDYKTRRK